MCNAREDRRARVGSKRQRTRGPLRPRERVEMIKRERERERERRGGVRGGGRGRGADP